MQLENIDETLKAFISILVLLPNRQLKTTSIVKGSYSEKVIELLLTDLVKWYDVSYCTEAFNKYI